jgi:hypothetical protein
LLFLGRRDKAGHCLYKGVATQSLKGENNRPTNSTDDCSRFELLLYALVPKQRTDHFQPQKHCQL